MSDLYGVKARIADFDKRNGGSPVYLNGWYLYANGAKRESDAMGVLIEPPEGKFQLLGCILYYHQARHAIAVREFDNLKEELQMSGCPQPEGLDQLRRLREIVGERNQTVNEAKARLDETEMAKRSASNRRQDAEQAEALTSFRDELKRLRI